jgi:hypothetical protein
VSAAGLRIEGYPVDGRSQASAPRIGGRA